jgi:hypothetical protein
MAVTLEATIYGNDGESVGTKLMPNLQSVKEWANEADALAIKTYDFDKETETSYLKAGLKERWQQASEKTFEAVLKRAKSRDQ